MALAYSHRYDEASKLFHDEIEKTSNSTGRGDQFTVWYEIACVAVAADRPDEALQDLREAVNRGYGNADGLMNDPDLKNLHNTPKFQQLITELKRPPTGTTRPCGKTPTRIFRLAASFCLPPVECSLGNTPNRAANSRPLAATAFLNIPFYRTH